MCPPRSAAATGTDSLELVARVKFVVVLTPEKAAALRSSGSTRPPHSKKYVPSLTLIEFDEDFAGAGRGHQEEIDAGVVGAGTTSRIDRHHTKLLLQDG
jgi:hypothetical protein